MLEIFFLASVLFGDINLYYYSKKYISTVQTIWLFVNFVSYYPFPIFILLHNQYNRGDFMWSFLKTTVILFQQHPSYFWISHCVDIRCDNYYQLLQLLMVFLVVFITISVLRLDIRWFSWRCKVKVSCLNVVWILLYQWCAACSLILV